MAISFVAGSGNPGGSNQNDPFGNGDGSNQNTVVIDKPVGTAEDDVMVGGCTSDTSSGTWTAPTNWAIVISQLHGGNHHSVTGSRVVGASEPSTHTWSLSFSSEKCGSTVAWAGADTTPTIVSAAENSVGSTNTPTAPTITPADGAGLYIFTCIDTGAGKPFGGPGGSPTYTERSDMADGTSSSDVSAASYTAIHGTGATGAKVCSSSASERNITHHLGVAPAAGGGGFIPYPNPRYSMDGGMQPMGGM